VGVAGSITFRLRLCVGVGVGVVEGVGMKISSELFFRLGVASDGVEGEGVEGDGVGRP
jgi:hypothetical protein